MSYHENPGDLEWIESLANEGVGEFEDYYPASAAGELEPSAPYYGRNVVWDGIPGQMIRVYPQYLEAIDGNIFNSDKLAAIVSGIEQADDQVVFTAPYGTVSVIDIQSIKESIEYARDYPDHVLTTGDEDLDQWIVDPDDFLEEQGYDTADLKEYAKDAGAYLEFWSDDPEDRVDRAEEMKEALVLIAEMNEKLADAVADSEGDLGEMEFTIRDGNHRGFGSLISGEPYIYMTLEDNQLQDLDAENPADQLILELLS